MTTTNTQAGNEWFASFISEEWEKEQGGELVCECPVCQGTGRNSGSQQEGGCEDCEGRRVVKGVALGTLTNGRRFYLDGWEVYMVTDIGQDVNDEFTWSVSVKTGRGVRLNNGYIVRTV